jgi:hypothetical protein
MNESNLTLFKQALCEGLSNRIDHLMSECNEKAHCSRRHTIAMRTIVYGKIGENRTITPKTRWIIAILVSAAIILTSCAIAYRDQILRVIKYIPDYVIGMTYSKEDPKGYTIDTVYELSYIPDGYVLTESIVDILAVKHIFTNSENNTITFLQIVIQGSSTYIDQEDSTSYYLNVGNYQIYYNYAKGNHLYIWNDGKYSMSITSDANLTNEEILSIIDGIKAK